MESNETSGRCVLKHVLCDSAVGSAAVASFARPAIQNGQHHKRNAHSHIQIYLAITIANSNENICRVLGCCLTTLS